jgi:outer membrane receptor protein involved in Fe transport
MGIAYIEAGAKLKFIDIKAGARMEYVDARIKFDSNNSEDITFNKTYFNVFPYISLNKAIGDNLDLTLHYRQNIYRPSYSDLTPSFVYRDSLSYVKGNPYLRPEISNQIGFDINLFKNFNLSFEYDINVNELYIHNYQDLSNPAITISTMDNRKNKIKELYAGVSYYLQHSDFSVSASLNCRKPFDNVHYLNGTAIKMNNPIYYFQTSGYLNIGKNTILSCSFMYSSCGDDDNMKKIDYSELSAGIYQYFLKKTLILSLSLNDIFNSRQSNRWTSYDDKIVYTMDSHSPSRSLVLTLRYRWGLAKNNIQDKSANEESTSRL